MAVLWAPLSLTRRNDHFRRLAAAVGQGDPEAFAETEVFAFHGVLIGAGAACCCMPEP
jgi:hypothetical protein